jgi:hypothetical protein
MTAMDNDITATTEDDTVSNETEPVTNADLNRYAKDQKAKAEAVQRELLEVRFEQVGLDPKKGLGKAVIGGYEGDTSLEAVTKYLKDEYEYEPPEGQTNDPTPVEEAQATVDGLVPTSQPLTPVNQDDPLAVAEAQLVSPEGNRNDAASTIALKVERYLDRLPTQTG